MVYKNSMEKIKQYKYIIIVALIILVGIFYWFQIRPAQARKECIKRYPNAFGRADIGRLMIIDQPGYEKCLREHGLNN
jgi:hypothetical protein